jgi:hypothetical protein
MPEKRTMSTVVGEGAGGLDSAPTALKSSFQRQSGALLVRVLAALSL